MIQNSSRCRIFARSCLLWLVLLTVAAGVACRQPVAFIGLPQDRYDHNRTIEVVIEKEGSEAIPFLLGNQHYAPLASADLPALTLKGYPKAPDGLPEAILVPVFTGLPIPLDSRPDAPRSGDREDLIEYLAAGPLAGDGVESPDIIGDVALAEREYRPLLDFLGSAEALKGSREDLLKRLTAVKIKAGPVRFMDSRFHPASFADTLAVRFRRFWFVLFKAPGQAGYSRLVIIPNLKR